MNSLSEKMEFMWLFSFMFLFTKQNWWTFPQGINITVTPFLWQLGKWTLSEKVEFIELFSFMIMLSKNRLVPNMKILVYLRHHNYSHATSLAVWEMNSLWKVELLSFMCKKKRIHPIKTRCSVPYWLRMSETTTRQKIDAYNVTPAHRGVFCQFTNKSS